MSDRAGSGRKKFGFHWWVLGGFVLGMVLGALLHNLDTVIDPGFRTEVNGETKALEVVAVRPGSDAAKGGVAKGQVIKALVTGLGRQDETRIPVADVAAFEAAREGLDIGEIAHVDTGGAKPLRFKAALAEGCSRDRWLTPFRFVAEIFLSLLKMLIVPLVLTSIITGVAGLKGSGDLGRLGTKTFGYYVLTSMLAIFGGLGLANLIKPGVGARIGLSVEKATEFEDLPSLWDIFRRIVPPNIFEAFADNGAMLQIIFFGLMVGYAITRVAEPHASRLGDFFDSLFAAMMEIAKVVLALIPLGVMALIARLVGETGFGIFKPLAVYMVTVVAGLLFHACVVLPLLLRFLGRVNPLKHARACAPALVTAYFTSSSSVTLPVTMESVSKRAGVSNKVSSFVLPLGATINMDGTALYEAVAA
ncbi:MAG: dicarboxylate/amino acid:cation symporter, partial [Salinibacterium sp.]|nr:dicarboxylate/amino acid:cation symporter [Salinibacterium sp.]